MSIEKLPLSVSIISYNEEANIGRTLESVSEFASEIIVLDSFSTDKTKEIAQSFSATVIQEEWKGHIAQKNSALGKCSQPWILCLDCDEVVSPELKESIIAAVKSDRKKSYSVNRRTFYLGKLMKRAWQPDLNLRLVRKDSSPSWKGLDPHDFLQSNDETLKLRGDLLHYSYRDLKQHLEKTISYAGISARSYSEASRKFSLLKLLLNPPMAFIKIYFIQMGFLDGIRGLFAALSSALGTFLKYAFLFEKKT